MGRNLVVDLSQGLELAFNLLSVEGVEEYLDVLLSIQSHSSRLAGNSGGVADVLKNGGVHGCEGSGSGSLLCLVHDSSLGNDRSGGDHDNGPVELAFEVGNDFLADLLVCDGRSEWDLNEEALAL